jgi:uncharacterized protein YukE
MPAPSSELTAPVAHAPLPTALTEAMNIQDWLSPSTYLLKGIELVFGFNPVDWLSEQFGGDWNEVSKSADAIRKLGDYAMAMAHQVDDVARELGLDWTGNAADAAVTHFNRLQASLEDLDDPFSDIATELDQCAVGMQQTAEAIGSIMTILLDHLIDLGICALATAASSWTGVGALIGGGATAYKIYKCERTWDQVVTAHDAAVTAAEGTVGLVAGWTSFVNMDEDLVLSGGAYDHPAVA